MPDRKACLEQLIAAANAQHDGNFSDELAGAFGDLGDLNEADQQWVRQRLVGALPHLESPAGAGLVAIWFGAEVENGADPDFAGLQLLETLLSWCRRVETDSDDSRPDPELSPALELGIQYLGQAAVAHLARSRRLRAQAQNTQILEELARVEHLVVGALWARQLLTQQSGELLVLHAEEAVGVRVSYHNLSNCFHLFTLLQGLLAGIMPDAREPDREVIAAARGEELEGGFTDEAWWHFGQPDSDQPELGSSVWGEAPPSTIGSVDGVQVLLLWPRILGSRSWDSGFFGPVIESSPAAVELIQVLDAEQVTRWRQRLGLADA